MSSFQYNGIYLPYPFHTSFQQEAAYDESGTDRIYTKFDLTVQCVINTNYASAMGLAACQDAQGNNIGSPAQMMGQLRTMLLQQRRPLAVSFAGTNIIPNAIGKGVDARNGPQPQYCNCTQMTNTTFLMSYRIITWVWENNSLDKGVSTNQPGADCLNNRWEESVVINESGYSTRTRRGRMIIRSDNASGSQADDIRAAMAVVGVPDGFTRESSEYTIQPDGLAIAYTIKDRERFLLPPYPAFDASGTYSESLTRQGAYRGVECRVKLKGKKGTPPGVADDPDATQAALIQAAIAIAFDKVGGPKTPNFKIEQLQVTIPLYDNEVDVILRCIKLPGTDGKDVNSRFASMTGPDQSRFVDPPLGSDPDADTPIIYSELGGYNLTGSAGLFLQAAAYYDPSVVGVKVDTKTDQLSKGAVVGQGGTQGS